MEDEEKTCLDQYKNTSYPGKIFKKVNSNVQYDAICKD